MMFRFLLSPTSIKKEENKKKRKTYYQLECEERKNDPRRKKERWKKEDNRTQLLSLLLLLQQVKKNPLVASFSSSFSSRRRYSGCRIPRRLLSDCQSSSRATEITPPCLIFQVSRTDFQPTGQVLRPEFRVVFLQVGV